jgi:hypothetical protein
MRAQLGQWGGALEDTALVGMHDRAEDTGHSSAASAHCSGTPCSWEQALSNPAVAGSGPRRVAIHTCGCPHLASGDSGAITPEHSWHQPVEIVVVFVPVRYSRLLARGVPATAADVHHVCMGRLIAIPPRLARQDRP